MHMIDGKFRTLKLPNHELRMNYENSAKYYTEKINKAMQWIKKPKDYSAFEIMLESVIKKVVISRDRMIKREARKIQMELIYAKS